MACSGGNDEGDRPSASINEIVNGIENPYLNQ